MHISYLIFCSIFFCIHTRISCSSITENSKSSKVDPDEEEHEQKRVELSEEDAGTLQAGRIFTKFMIFNISILGSFYMILYYTMFTQEPTTGDKLVSEVIGFQRRPQAYTYSTDLQIWLSIALLIFLTACIYHYYISHQIKHQHSLEDKLLIEKFQKMDGNIEDIMKFFDEYMRLDSGNVSEKVSKDPTIYNDPIAGSTFDKVPKTDFSNVKAEGQYSGVDTALEMKVEPENFKAAGVMSQLNSQKMSKMESKVRSAK